MYYNHVYWLLVIDYWLFIGKCLMSLCHDVIVILTDFHRL